MKINLLSHVLFSLRNMHCISNAHILTFQCCHGNNDDADVDDTGGHPIRKVADDAI